MISRSEVNGDWMKYIFGNSEVDDAIGITRREKVLSLVVDISGTAEAGETLRYLFIQDESNEYSDFFIRWVVQKLSVLVNVWKGTLRTEARESVSQLDRELSTATATAILM